MEHVISCRLDDKEVKFLEQYAEQNNETKAKILRELLEEGRKMEAIQLYKKGKTSLGKAAEVAGVCLSDFMDLLSEFGVTSNLTMEDFKESFQHGKRLTH